MSSLYETFSREWARDRYSPRVVGVLEQLAAGVLKCVREKLRTAELSSAGMYGARRFGAAGCGRNEGARRGQG